MPAPTTDARFERIRGSLTRAAASADSRAAAKPGAAAPGIARPGTASLGGAAGGAGTFGTLERAAVALILRASDQLDVLMIKRAVFENDPWSGHMALPGGREESEDDSLAHTARRETQEETGLVLGPHALLGELPVVSAQSARIPRFHISPFVFGVPAGAEAWVASREVETLFWVPVARLNDPTVRTTVRIPLVGSTREFPALNIEGETVWGLTYRILNRFLEVAG